MSVGRQSCQRVDTPFDVVAGGELLAGMGAAALLACFPDVDGGDGVGHQVFELQRLDQVRVPDHRTVENLDVFQFLPDLGNAAAPGHEGFLGPEHCCILLHGRCMRSRRTAVGLLPLACRMRSKRSRCVSTASPSTGRHRGFAVHHLAGADRRCTAENYEIDQRVAAQAVGAVHRGTTGLSHGHQARRNAIRFVIGRIQHLGQKFVGIPPML